ncbi:MAG: hypothetical protein FWD46_08370 [Cystobacterineae bacterium]|nr:hypothetical protein [Cystobacterineae bacterium]
MASQNSNGRIEATGGRMPPLREVMMGLWVDCGARQRMSRRMLRVSF